MPNIVNANEMSVTTGDGWEELLLADAQTFGAVAMIARRWNLIAQAQMGPTAPAATDTMLYIIEGSGQAAVGDDVFTLETEDVLWLEPNEQVTLTAGDNGLSVLVGFRDQQ